MADGLVDILLDEETPMIYTSLCVLAMSVSAVAAPLSNPVHLHPKMRDTRVNVTLYNKGTQFRDVRVDGKTYTLLQHQSLTIKAPAGTVVYAGSRTPRYQRGDAMLELTPQTDKTRIVIN